MKIKSLKYIKFTLFAALVIGGGPGLSASHAREGTVDPSLVECYAPQGEIITLREPFFEGVLSAWHILYAEGGMDSFSDIAVLDAGHIVAAGSYNKGKDDTGYRPLLVKFDERQKPVWIVREEGAAHKTIQRLYEVNGGFTVIGNIDDAEKGRGIYIGSYNEDGSVRGKAVPFFEKGGRLDARAFVPSQDGKGYIIAAQFIDDRDEEKQRGILMKISKAGELVWKRSYTAGRSTVFNNIQTAQDGSHMVSGQIVTDGNKSSGWFLVVDDNGAVKWQETYPRGLAATFQAAGQAENGDYILIGKSRSQDHEQEGLAAWIMRTDSKGKMIWQRFLQGAYIYDAPDLIVYEDGRASVLLNAGGLRGDQRSHVRLVTLSPTGAIQHVEDFTDGQNAAASRLVPGYAGERILGGFAQTSFGEGQETNEAAAAPSYTYDGWVVAATALDLYDNPCVRENKASPILP
ncbi:MAG: hypothetical protein WC989_09955 [Micavibrio sp.]